jgi:oligopeptide/dipeptide ABC transporter ATP-binding protein
MLKLVDVEKHFRPPSTLGRELAGFFGRRGLETDAVKAVRGVSLEVKAGEILGLVGESGSGKSTLGRIMCGLHRPDRGRCLFEDRDLTSFDRSQRRRFARRVQYMFQDPASSLNPRLSILSAISEGLAIHGLGDRAARRRRVHQLLEETGLSPELADRYPHQFSGGQRQRICLARALSLDPDLLIADEPASALDVSIQAQIVNLLLDLKAKRGLTMVLISHDLALVRLAADRTAVMYGGLLMEVLPRDCLGLRDHHPYVKALWASADAPAEAGALILEGEPPDPLHPPPGCPFHPRCPEASAICAQKAPPCLELEPGRLCACWRRSQTRPSAGAAAAS